MHIYVLFDMITSATCAHTFLYIKKDNDGNNNKNLDTFSYWYGQLSLCACVSMCVYVCVCIASCETEPYTMDSCYQICSIVVVGFYICVFLFIFRSFVFCSAAKHIHNIFRTHKSESIYVA